MNEREGWVTANVHLEEKPEGDYYHLSVIRRAAFTWAFISFALGLAAGAYFL